MENDTKELTITRIFDAPRELVFKAWTDPKLVAKWWGPKGVTNPICEVDAQPKGALHIMMLAGEELGDLKGQEWPMKGFFKEVKPPEKLVFTTFAFYDENDKNAQLENLVTVTFEEDGKKTKITLHVLVTKATPAMAGPLSGMKAGWTQSIDKLEEMFKK